MTLRAMLAGALSSWDGDPCPTGQRLETGVILGLPGWGLDIGLTNQFCKNIDCYGEKKLGLFMLPITKLNKLAYTLKRRQNLKTQHYPHTGRSM